MEALGSFRTRSRVAITVSDSTRTLDTAAALEALAQVVEGPATVVVGLGLHRPLRPEERAPLEAACPWPVVDHDPDACVSLGRIEDTPCEVHPAFVEADTLITVGCVELHQYAGFSGGHKGVVVGCGGRATLNHLHSKAFVCHPDVQVGRLSGNPFRDRVDAIGEWVGVDLALQWIPGHGWLAGPPTTTLKRAADSLDPWIPTANPVATALLKVPASKAVNFYQASRAATYLALSPFPPLLSGARLVLEAACPEGLGLGSGELAFAELLAKRTPLCVPGAREPSCWPDWPVVTGWWSPVVRTWTPLSRPASKRPLDPPKRWRETALLSWKRRFSSCLSLCLRTVERGAASGPKKTPKARHAKPHGEKEHEGNRTNHPQVKSLCRSPEEPCTHQPLHACGAHGPRRIGRGLARLSQGSALRCPFKR